MKILYVLLFLPIITFSQNLVLNPSFEEYHYCQKHIYAYDKDDLPGYPKIRFFAKDWAVNCESPDFFCTQCPKNDFVDLIEPHSGEAYIGLGGRFGHVIECITATLSEPLQKDKKYLLTFYIRFAGDDWEFYSSNIGVCFFKKFSSCHLFYGCKGDKNFTADGKWSIPIKDTIWQEISFLYTAKGGEQYFSLGEFYEEDYKKLYEKYYKLQAKGRKKRLLKFYDSHQKYAVRNPNYNNSDNGSESFYYYIDDVSVELVDDNFEIKSEQQDYVRPR